MAGRNMNSTSERLDVQRLGVFTINSIPNATQSREILEILIRIVLAGHVPNDAI